MRYVIITQILLLNQLFRHLSYSGDNQQSARGQNPMDRIALPTASDLPQTSFNAYGNVTVQAGSGVITTTNKATGYLATIRKQCVRDSTTNEGICGREQHTPSAAEPTVTLQQHASDLDEDDNSSIYESIHSDDSDQEDVERKQCPLCQESFLSQIGLVKHALRVHAIDAEVLARVQQSLIYNGPHVFPNDQNKITTQDEGYPLGPLSTDEVTIKVGSWGKLARQRSGQSEILLTMTYVKDAKDKITSKPWKQPLGMAMLITESTLEDLSGWYPWLSILGGALIIGSSLLNLQPTMEEVNKHAIKIIGDSDFNRESQHGKHVLELLQTLKYIRLDSSELLDNVVLIRQEVQTSYNNMAQGIKYTKKDLSDFEYILKLVEKILTGTEPLNHSISLVDLSFQYLVEGCNNLEATLGSITFKNFWFQLQMTKRKKILNSDNISDCINSLSNTKESKCQGVGNLHVTSSEKNDMGEQIFNYLLVVKAKLFLLSITYYIFEKDSVCSKIIQRVTNEFESFNHEYNDLLQIYKATFGSTFIPGKDPSIGLFQLNERCIQILMKYSILNKASSSPNSPSRYRHDE